MYCWLASTEDGMLDDRNPDAKVMVVVRRSKCKVLLL